MNVEIAVAERVEMPDWLAHIHRNHVYDKQNTFSMRAIRDLLDGRRHWICENWTVEEWP